MTVKASPDRVAALVKAKAELRGKGPRIRRELAASADTSPTVLELLSKSFDLQVANGVASNPNTPADALAKMVDFDVICEPNFHLALNPNTPPELVSRITEMNGNSEFLKLIPEMYPRTRFDMATNPVTPPEILIFLSNDENISVRQQVASNPSTPEDCLLQMCESKDEDVLWCIAANPECGIRVLRRLVNFDSETIRIRIAEGKYADAEILEKLSHSNNSIVIGAVAGNPNSAPDTLRRLSREEMRTSCYGLAGNPASPTEVLELLGGYENPLLNKKACEVLSTRPDCRFFEMNPEGIQAILASRIPVSNSEIADLKLMPLEWLKKMYPIGEYSKMS